MTQIFRESNNSLSLFTLLLLVAGLTVSAVSYWFFWKAPAQTRVGIIVQQPVAFSHKHHVKGAGLDCRFCHAQVETSNTAGMPSTEVCMSCHSQLFVDSPQLKLVHQSWDQGKPLAWNRVHDMPDFVYFNHSIHVHKGVACISCHGQVDEMPLTVKAEPMTMEWCLGCHFHPDKYVRAREEVFRRQPQPAQPGQDYLHRYHIDTARLRNCYECHR